MITVVCVLVRGNVPFTAEYVQRLRSMLERKLSRPHRLFCLTDQPEQLRKLDVTTIRVDPPPGLPGWWSKLEIFNPNHGLRGPGLYLDLDVLLVEDLGPVVDFRADFALVPHDGGFEGARGLQVVKRFNSSVMKFDLGSAAHLYRRWTPDVARRLWGDQDWIGEQLPHGEVMPLEWFPRLSQLPNDGRARPWSHHAKVILCKSPKNHDAVRRLPWFDAAWR